MLIVTLYYRSGNPACELVQRDLNALQKSIPHQLVLVDVGTDSSLDKNFGEHVPVVQVGPYHIYPPITQQELQVAMGAAQDRADQLTRVGDAAYQKRLKRGRALTKTDQVTYWLSQHYMAVINLFVFLYVGIPFLAPILMKNNLNLPAKIIYTIYQPMCHQLAFRSWFLFGEQSFYPLNLAHIQNALTYEQVIQADPVDLNEARGFLGNPITGFKVALCERDVAIWGSILVFGLFFSLFRNKIKPIPWYLWLGIGMIPIGIDGVSQLISIVNGIIPGWSLLRESTPLLRTITGALFGTTTGWYLFPVLEESFQGARILLVQKMRVIEELNSQKNKEKYP